MTLKPLMTTFPRKGTQVRDRALTPLEEDRTPVYVDQFATSVLTGAGDVIGALVTAMFPPPPSASSPTLFVGNGALRYGIRQKFMTSLRAQVMCTFQVVDEPLDSRVASQLERVLERLEVRITEDRSEELAMPALPLRAFSQGVMFLDGHQPFCDTDDFKITLAVPDGGLPSIPITSTVKVSALIYLEAVFQ